ncbi:unnamed protein product [Somion occarium]|uniref:Spindle assembly checkpoint component MAD1 n=1 Tax=Somion occarium TaxID=3059160 RepID=A0ABP1D1Q3_9APHY
MDNDEFSTPVSASRSSVPWSTSVKRDSLAADLERDPQLSTAKRKQRTQAFHSQMTFASLERQVASLQTSKAELEAKIREKDAVIDRLEGDRRWLSDREKEEREEKERERKEREEEKRKLSSDLRALRNSFQALRGEHDDLQDEYSNLKRQSSQTIATQKADTTTLSRQVALLQDELASVQAIAEQRSNALEELQLQFDELSEAQANTSRLSSGGGTEEDENWSIVREELHRQANHLRTVETANAKMNSELIMLRHRNTSLEVLKEQKRELEKKVSGVEQLKEKVVRLEAELDAARQEREDWASKSASTPSVAVTQSLSDLRLKYATLLEENGSNVALLHRREKELEDAQERENAFGKRIEDLEAEIELLKEGLTRAEQRASLAEREVGFQQAMLASFTAEETHDGVNTSRLDDVAKQRVSQLESLLADYKATIAKLESEINDLTGDLSSTGGDRRPRVEIIKDLESERHKREAAESALRELESTTESQVEQIDKLEQTLFELQGEIGGGRHIPPGVRVLSLRDNPASQWEDLSRKALERVKDENEALLKRLKELEESGVRGRGGNGGQTGEDEELVPRKSWEAAIQEKEELEEALKQKEKRLIRLKQVFSAKTDEFKEAIASILGVKLAFYPNGQVRVTSQFDLNAAFVFQPTKPPSASSLGKSNSEAMTMKLVAKGEGGPEELPQLMRYWVEQEQCIPCFLASVTLECYEKMKREGLRPAV